MDFKKCSDFSTKISRNDIQKDSLIDFNTIGVNITSEKTSNWIDNLINCQLPTTMTIETFIPIVNALHTDHCMPQQFCRYMLGYGKENGVHSYSESLPIYKMKQTDSYDIIHYYFIRRISMNDYNVELNNNELNVTPKPVYAWGVITNSGQLLAYLPDYTVTYTCPFGINYQWKTVTEENSRKSGSIYKPDVMVRINEFEDEFEVESMVDFEVPSEKPAKKPTKKYMEEPTCISYIIHTMVFGNFGMISLPVSVPDIRKFCLLSRLLLIEDELSQFLTLLYGA